MQIICRHDDEIGPAISSWHRRVASGEVCWVDCLCDGNRTEQERNAIGHKGQAPEMREEPGCSDAIATYHALALLSKSPGLVQSRDNIHVSLQASQLFGTLARRTNCTHDPAKHMEQIMKIIFGVQNAVD